MKLKDAETQSDFEAYIEEKAAARVRFYKVALVAVTLAITVFGLWMTISQESRVQEWKDTAYDAVEAAQEWQSLYEEGVADYEHAASIVRRLSEDNGRLRKLLAEHKEAVIWRGGPILTTPDTDGALFFHDDTLELMIDETPEGREYGSRTSTVSPQHDFR